MNPHSAFVLFIVALAGACKPAVKGLCSGQKDCRTGAYCSPDGICLSVPPLAISVFVPPASGAINGWVPRTSGNLEVRATIEDGGAGAPQGAMLTFDACPASAPCSYPGTIVSQTGGITVFSFDVPRFAQAAGSEAPMSVTVTATDVAGKEGQGKTSLHIDDAPPQIAPIAPVTAGVTGEDGKTWFTGGNGAPDVEISDPYADSGAGVASLTLHLTDPDVGGPDPAPAPQPDGSVHFVLSPRRVHGREGAMSFLLTAKDQLQHQSQAPGAILVDALPPTVTQPHVDYGTATPDLATICNASDDPIRFLCGRQAQTHVLPDDTVTASLDITDCGSGIQASAQPDATAAGGTKTLPLSQDNPASASACVNGNRTHHYKFQLDGTKVVLPAVDATGTAYVQLGGNAVDRVGNASASVANGGTSGDGLALVSLWRWKRKLNGAATGGPALLPGNGGQRQAALATDAGNVYVLPADGSAPATPASASGIAGDVATGANGNIYGVTSTVLYIVVAGSASSCQSQSGATLGLPPVIGAWGLGSATGEQALVLASSHSGTNNLFAFRYDSAPTQQQCVRDSAAPALTTGEPFIGATATSTTLYAGHQKGFTSYTVASPTTSVSYDTALVATGAPALGGTPVFAESTNRKLHSTQQSTATPCSALTPCWTDAAPGFAPALAAAPLSTPVFGLGAVWTVDTNGTVYSYSQSSGVREFAPVALGVAASPPVLLADGSALVVQGDCGVTVVSAGGTARSLGKVCSAGAFAATPFTPAIDDRGNGEGVAYVGGLGGWVYAMQTPAAPLAAGATAWPRPGRDSCNSRNAGSSCP
ncbi:MAG: hypothetical protein LC689_22390 [Myxococcales bacterium]|nr:hypothetical protein [Myxococcales bacterium]